MGKGIWKEKQKYVFLTVKPGYNLKENKGNNLVLEELRKNNDVITKSQTSSYIYTYLPVQICAILSRRTRINICVCVVPPKRFSGSQEQSLNLLSLATPGHLHTFWHYIVCILFFFFFVLPTLACNFGREKCNKNESF